MWAAGRRWRSRDMGERWGAFYDLIDRNGFFSTHVFPTELLRGDSVEVGGGGDGLAVSLRTGVACRGRGVEWSDRRGRYDMR